MRGERDQISPHRMHIQPDPPRRLRRINMKRRTRRPHQNTNRSKILRHANLIIHRHHTDQDSGNPQCRLQHRQIQQTIGLHRQNHRLETLRRQRLHALQHTFMLSGEGNNPPLPLRPSKPRRTLDGEIIRLRRTRGENNLPPLSTNQRSHMLPRTLHRRLGLTTHGMLHTMRIGEILLPPRTHGRSHTRVERRGGMVI